MSTNEDTKATVQFSVTFSKETADVINKMTELPQYRNNRSFVIETLVTSNPTFVSFNKKTKKS